MDILDFLSRLPIANHLDTVSIQALSSELETKKLPHGAMLFTLGDAGDALYIVVSGKLQARIRTSDEAGTFVNVLGPGEFVGEMALLTAPPRSNLRDSSCEPWV
jgi:CRP-like cAMP-binding protein